MWLLFLCFLTRLFILTLLRILNISFFFKQYNCFLIGFAHKAKFLQLHLIFFSFLWVFLDRLVIVFILYIFKLLLKTCVISTFFKWRNWLMHHVKVILILFLKNISQQKIHILLLFVVFDELGTPSTLLNKPTKKVNLFKNLGKSI